jgi:methyl-accepting chemotaxis protein
MVWFSNLRIASKLLISFLIMACIAGIIGYVGITQISSISDADTRLYKQMTVPLTHLADMNRAFLNIRVNVRDLMIARSEDESIKYHDNLLKLENDIAGYQSEYQKSLFSEEEKSVYNDFSTGVKEYFADLSNFTRLLNSGKKDEALTYMRGDFLVVAKKIDSSLMKMREEKVALAQATSEANAALSGQSAKIMAIFMVIGIIFAVTLGFWLAAVIGKPVRKITEACNQLAIGDLDQKIDFSTKDEVGMLADAFRKISDSQKELSSIANRIANGDLNVTIKERSEKDMLSKSMQQVLLSLNGLVEETISLTKHAAEGQLDKRGHSEKFNGGYKAIVVGINSTLDAVISPINEALAILEKVAARDMTARVTGMYKGDFARIKEVLNKAVQNLDEALDQVMMGSEQVATAAMQISNGSQSLSQSSSEQASSLEEISSSIQEMSSMINLNSGNAKEAQRLSAEAHDSTLKGVESMKRLSIAVDQIKESSDATAKIVKTIDEIAFQTNLLALNAAVEAARAGDAGKGFAVVAEEVRNLAMRSAEAAKNTSSLIEESVKKSEGGVSINQEVLKNLQEINDNTSKVSGVMAEIAAASEQQGIGIEQVNKAIEQMNQVTQATAASAEESASASEELAGQASETKRMVQAFRLSAGKMSVAMQEEQSSESIQDRPMFKPAMKIARQQYLNKPAISRTTSRELIPFDEMDHALGEF